MHFLIDADSLIYKAGCGNETRWYIVEDAASGLVAEDFQFKKDAVAWTEENEGDWIITKQKEAGPLKDSISNLKRLLKKITEKDNCHSYDVYIGGKDNFRYDIYSEYKAQRDPLAKPLQEKELRQYLIDHWYAIVVDGEEVDDRVSILQRDGTCIVSIDKDLDNTAGWHYNYDKDLLYFITPEEADLNFYRQLITGDKSTDNIPGLPRHGKVKAEKALPEHGSVEDMCTTVWEMYKELGFDKDYFIMNGQLLWMRRTEGEFWQPPIELE